MLSRTAGRIRPSSARSISRLTSAASSGALGQWQNGQFVGVAPTDLPGAQPIVFPKPAW